MTAVKTPRWRVFTLQGMFVLVGLLLCGRLVELQVLRHNDLHDQAEAQWKHLQEIVPERGNIYDRFGNPLALSVTKWQVGVATRMVDNPTGVAVALDTLFSREGFTNAGRREIERRIRQADGQYLVLLKEVLLRGGARDQLIAIPGIQIDRLRQRVYPLDGKGASLIGCYRRHSARESRESGVEWSATGLERSLASYLDGQPGREWRLDTARPGESLGSVVVDDVVHGNNLVLTIDARLQEICEDELARSVAGCGAIGGSILIVDPHNGDVLAAASCPGVVDRDHPGPDATVWNNRNFTFQYEPGSVFKIFSAASLLSNSAIDTATIFDCSNEDFGRFRIRNSDGHSYGNMAFMQAFSQSSNIYFARAIANLSSTEVYRDLVEFGFGQRARFPYPAQPKGILKAPATWSGRSQATIAIGQEVAVTPLQLAMATSCVANGGFLYTPRIVKEIRDQDNRLLKRFPPEQLRQVLSDPMAELLRQAMGQAVRQGTANATDLDWIAIGGKTGTAQKSREGSVGYTPGCYIASFTGCVPIESPRMTILVIIDEPRGFYHYAAQSAVPLFARVVTEIRRSTNWLSGVEGSQTEWVSQPGDEKLRTVPDVLHLYAERAAVEIRQAGLTPVGYQNNGLVVEQIPGPGSLCADGATICLTVATDPVLEMSAAPVCPDLTGLSNRELRGLAARLGVPVSIEGVGYVAEQQPVPGVALNEDGIKVRMEASWL